MTSLLYACSHEFAALRQVATSPTTTRWVCRRRWSCSSSRPRRTRTCASATSAGRSPLAASRTPSAGGEPPLTALSFCPQVSLLVRKAGGKPGRSSRFTEMLEEPRRAFFFSSPFFLLSFFFFLILFLFLIVKCVFFFSPFPLLVHFSLTGSIFAALFLPDVHETPPRLPLRFLTFNVKVFPRWPCCNNL